MPTQTLLSCALAGVQHAKPDFSALTYGDNIRLVPEPENTYDTFAIKVVHDTAGRLGYIPKESTIVMHDALRNGLHWVAKVQHFDDTGRYPKIYIIVTTEI